MYAWTWATKRMNLSLTRCTSWPLHRHPPKFLNGDRQNRCGKGCTRLWLGFRSDSTGMINIGLHKLDWYTFKIPTLTSAVCPRMWQRTLGMYESIHTSEQLQWTWSLMTLIQISSGLMRLNCLPQTISFKQKISWTIARYLSSVSNWSL